MCAEYHGIDHQHLVRHGSKDPHRYQYVQYLIDTEYDAGLREGIALSFEIDSERLGKAPGKREQNGGAAENDQVFLLYGHARQLYGKDEAPDQDG